MRNEKVQNVDLEYLEMSLRRIIGSFDKTDKVWVGDTKMKVTTELFRRIKGDYDSLKAKFEKSQSEIDVLVNHDPVDFKEVDKLWKLADDRFNVRESYLNTSKGERFKSRFVRGAAAVVVFAALANVGVNLFKHREIEADDSAKAETTVQVSEAENSQNPEEELELGAE